MPIKNKSVTVTYTAWHSTTGPKTGDVANHTLRLIRDGVAAAPVNAPAEVDAANAPGEYRVLLTAAEMNADFVTLCGKSATAGVSLIPVKLQTDQGIMPGAAPGVSGGFLTYGTGPGQINPVGGNVPVGSYATGQSPAELVLATPANKLATNATGQVTIGGYGTNLDPASLILATPANKLATNTSGFVSLNMGQTFGTVTAGTVGMALSNANSLAFTSGNVNANVAAYSSGLSPSAQILINTSNKLLTDVSGQVTASNAGGAGGTDWTAAEREQIRWVLGLDGTQTATANAYRLAAMMTILNKLTFDASNNVSAKVGAYATGQSPAELVLATPANKLATNASGFVTTTDAASVATILSNTNSSKAKTDLLTFAGSLLTVQVNAYALTYSPGEQILLTPGNKVAANGSGQVTAAPVVLSSGAFANISYDGLTFDSSYRLIASALLGEIRLDPATRLGTISSPTDPAIVKIRYETDPTYTSRINVTLTPAA